MWSISVLIGRAAWPYYSILEMKVFDVSFSHRFPGGFSGGATPDPIPNSVVKPTRADGTSTARYWKSRSPPGSL